MTILGIGALILLGIILILVEIFFVPGVGFVGVIGFLIIFLGIYLAYDLSTNYGHITLLVGALVSLGLGVLAFRENTWIKLGVKTNLAGKSKSSSSETGLAVGDQGKAVGRIAPIGKAKFGVDIVEVKAFNNMIEPGAKLEIVKLEESSIIVKNIEPNA